MREREREREREKRKEREREREARSLASQAVDTEEIRDPSPCEGRWGGRAWESGLGPDDGDDVTCHCSALLHPKLPEDSCIIMYSLDKSQNPL